MVQIGKRESPPRALVLGAAGHAGSAVVRELVDRGYRTVAASRRRRAPINLEGLAVDHLRCDLDRIEHLDGILAGHRIVVDAAALYPLSICLRPGDHNRLLARAIRRTDAVIESAARHGARIALISSFTTLPRPRDAGWAWLSQARSLYPYFAFKEAIECRYLAAARTGLPAAVVNPPAFLGPWDLKARELCYVPRLLSGELPFSLSHVVNVIDVRDVARGVVAALEAERYGEPVPLAGHDVSISDLNGWICLLGGAREPGWRLPAPLAAGAAAAVEILQRAVGAGFRVPSLALVLLCESYAMSVSAVQRELGVKPRPLSDTVRDAIAWYQRLGYC